jgi:RHS repeat-associated protein
MEEQNTATNGPAPMNVYLYAGDQIVENVTMGYFYYQDSLGNTSHVTDAIGNLLERYTYSAFGTPTFFSANNTQLSTSAYGIRHLFQGQLWTQETGLNDYRNRVELPVMGVFLQPDPIGFKGDVANIYRFCNNNAVNRTDPMGLVNTNAGTTLEERMRLFYGSGDTGGGLYDLNVANSRTMSLTIAGQYRNEGQPHWSAKSERAEAKKLLLRQIKFGEDSTGGGTDEAPYIIEPIMGRKVYKNPNDSPSLRRVDHIEEPGIPGHSRFLTHVHTRVGVDKEGHRLEDPTYYDKEALKTTERIYFTNPILGPQGRYEIYRNGKPPEMRDDLYR